MQGRDQGPLGGTSVERGHSTQAAIEATKDTAIACVYWFTLVHPPLTAVMWRARTQGAAAKRMGDSEHKSEHGSQSVCSRDHGIVLLVWRAYGDCPITQVLSSAYVDFYVPVYICIC